MTIVTFRDCDRATFETPCVRWKTDVNAATTCGCDDDGEFELWTTTMSCYWRRWRVFCHDRWWWIGSGEEWRGPVDRRRDDDDVGRVRSDVEWLSSGGERLWLIVVPIWSICVCAYTGKHARHETI